MQQEEIKQLIMNQLGLSGLSGDQSDAVLKEFVVGVMRQITKAVYKNLPVDQRELYLTLLESNDQEGLAKLFTQHLPNAKEIVDMEVKKEVESFRNDVEESLKEF